jgi:hypothetical protein
LILCNFKKEQRRIKNVISCIFANNKGEGAHLYKSATLSEMIEKKIFLRTQQSHYKAYKKARGV